MDFSSVGSLEPVDGGFRARFRWNANGSRKPCRGPRRQGEEAAKEDLESMRAAARGKSREDGFAAMKAEADALKAGKPPKEVGFIQNDNNAFRARVQFREEGAKRDIPGPWRPEEEAAKDDLACIRAAATGCYRRPSVAGGTVALPFRG